MDTALIPLERLARPIMATPPQPGPRPDLRWLKVADLRVDPGYQRVVSNSGRANILRIMEAFEWARFSPVIVTPAGAQFAIIDGQHRAAAALSLGLAEVPCHVVETANPAAIFAAVNGVVTPMTPLALFKAARAAGTGWALDLDRACAMAGITPLTYPVSAKDMKPLQTLAIATLRQRIARHGVEVVGRALAAAAEKAEAKVPGYFSANRIRNLISEHLEGRPPASATAPEVSRGDRIRDLARRGYGHQAIAAATGYSYAEIRATLAGGA